MNCPNRNLPDYQHNEELFGEGGALAIYKLAGDTNPKPIDAIKLLYPNTEVNKGIEAWNIGSYSGKNQKEFEPEIDDLIKNDPNAKVGGGESFNQVKERTITALGDILKTAPANSVVITHSTVLKFLKLWDDQNRPRNLSAITPEEYLKVSTMIGDILPIQGNNGTIHFIRHGKTDDNEDGNLRSNDTQLTEKGIKDAKKVAEELSKTDISQLYTSPLDRTIHTSDIIMSKQLEKNFDKQNNNSYQQKDIPQTPKQLKYELQSRINQAIQGTGPKSKIQDALNIYRGKEDASREIRENGGEKVWVWRKIEQSGLDYTHTLPVDKFIRKGAEHEVWEDPEFIKNQSNQFQQKNSSKQNPNTQLDNKVKEFLNSMGVEVQRLEDKGQNFSGMVDTLKGIISVVDGKADITTLSHEATHMFLDLLPEGSRLLDDIIDDVKKREQYDDVYEQYKDAPQYQNEGGSVNEEKIAKETAAHIIDDIIVGKFLDAKSKKWWEKLWDFIKKLFTGKSLDNFEQVAKDILGNKTEKLSKEKLAAIKEANGRGEIYYQLSDKDKANVEEWKKGATEIQKKMLDELVTNNKMSLNLDTHTYQDASDPTKIWTPLTTAIKGHFDESISAPNREAGTQVHSILEGVILGKKFNEIEPTDRIIEAARGMAYNAFQELIRNIKEDGSIIIPETILSDKISGIATSVDLIKIKPDGTRKIIDLKTSARNVLFKNKDGKWEMSTNYLSKAYDVKEGSRLGGKLTTNQQHGIQVSAQDRILSNMGYLNSDAPETYHIKVSFKDGKLEHIEVEGVIDHPQTANTEFVDKLLGPDTNVYTENNTIEEPDQEEIITEKLSASLDKIKEEFTRRKASPLAEMRETSINELKNTVSDIDNLQKAGQVKEAMGKVISYVQDITRESIKFIANEKNFDNSQYIQFLTEAMTLGDSNDELLPFHLRGDLNETQQNTFNSVKASLSELQEISTIRMNQYFLRNKANPNGPVDYNTLKKEWFPEKGIQDISLSGSWTTNFDALRNPIIREAVNDIQIAQKNSDMKNVEISDKWAKIGNDLRVLAGTAMDNPKEFFKFMYNLDKKGNITGYINPTSDKYYDKKDELQSALIDSKTGEYLKYIPITDLTKASAEDINHNKDLYYKKQALREFNSPEELNKDTGKIEKGLYHDFNNEYIRARDKVMQPLIHTTYEGEPLYLEWIPKKGLAEDSPSLKQFRNKYQVKDKYLSMSTKNGQPIGIVTEKEGYLPSGKYIIPNEFAGKEDMHNPRYVKLHTPTTDLDRAQLGFYKEFIKEFVESSQKMGGEAERFVANLGIIALQKRVFKKAAKEGLVNNLKHQWVEFFTAVHAGNVESTDANGVTRMALRIPNIGSLRSQKRIEDIENKITEIGNQKTAIGKAEYNKQLNDLNIQLQRETHKLSPDDIEYDVVKQITQFATGANTYFMLENVEGDLMAAQWALKQQKFIKETGRGIAKVDKDGNPVFKSENEVNSLRAMNQLIKNYYGVTLDETTLGVAVKRFQNLTSFLTMGLNIFNGLNNTILYQFNIAGQSLSGRYGLSAKNWVAAQKIVTTELLPGLVKKQLDKSIKYGSKRSYSKPESIMRQLAIKLDQKKVEGASGLFGKFYIFENFAIDTSQTTLAINGLKDFQIPNYMTGETSSVYDAFTYDPNTGESKLKDGFNQKDATAVVVKIGDIQTQAQGNYQSITQPAMTATVLGQLATQFHRFFAPSWNNRFSRYYEHKTLGPTEGSWRTAVSFVKTLKDYEGDRMKDMFDKNSDLWKNMPQHMKDNLIFDAIDLVKLLMLLAIGGVLKGIADGVSEDDPQQKRLMNFLAYTASRIRMEQQMFNPIFGWQEMAEFVQNPIAMSNTLKTFSQALYLSVDFPFQADQDRYYKNGVFVGDSKAAHQIQKLIPVYRQTNQWLNQIKAQTAEGQILGSQK